MKFLKWKKLALTLFLAGTFLFGNVFTASAAEKLYEQVETQPVTKGVIYEKKHRLTEDGWQDINVLQVDLNESNVRIAPVGSAKDYGLKETVLNLLSDNNAVAGVNASFFGMSGTYSTSFGVIVDDGEIQSMGADINSGKNEYATFFLDKEGVPFIDFFRVELEFWNNGEYQLELASVNKVVDMTYPMCLNRQAMDNTDSIDARYGGIVKITVQDGVITHISEKGETVEVPENGYLILISSSIYDGAADKFAVGQSAQVVVKPSLDLDKIQTAISGGGKILENGEEPAETGMVFKNRQPRTAIGITGDRNKLIIMTVDGRGDSIGASQVEMVWLMREYGVTDAMNMDGGGSTTMAVKTAEEDGLSVKNQVSDGAQRKVINALGIFNDGPMGEITQLVVKPSVNKVFSGGSITFDVYGFDEYYHKMAVPIENVVFQASQEGGVFNGAQYIPASEGKILVTASYNGAQGSAEVESMTLASLSPSIKELNLEVGGQAELTFTGVDPDGFHSYLPGTVEVSSDLGSYANGIFTAEKEGASYITCSYNGITCYVKLVVGGTTKQITSFEGMSNMKFTTSPSGMAGEGLKSTTVVADGTESVGLKYKFEQADTTQAAYLHFLTPIQIPGTPSSLTLSVYGNHSGDWVRGRLKDANGKEIIVDFTKNMDWDGWKEVTGVIPSDTAYPVSLEVLYVASLANQDTNDRIVYFDNLTGRFPFAEAENMPANTVITDIRNQQVTGRQEGSYYINLAGVVASSASALAGNEIYNTKRQEVHNALQQDSDLMVYVGKNDFQSDSGVETIRWNSGYQFYAKNGVDVVQLTAANGTMRTTNTWQWVVFKQDVLNSENKNVVFLLDRMPSSFSDPLEGALFTSVLSDIRKAGKTVFVVSSTGNTAWNSLEEGIRYINLPNLWTADGQLNQNYKLLRLKVTGNDITFDFVPVF